MKREQLQVMVFLSIPENGTSEVMQLRVNESIYKWQRMTDPFYQKESAKKGVANLQIQKYSNPIS